MSAPAGPTPPFGSIIDVHRLFGPLLIGVFFNMILYGLLIAQVMTYYQTAGRDSLWIRLLVAYVIFVETANTALDISVMYQPLVLEYGSIPGKLPTVFLTQPLCIAMIAFPIELFFIYRIRALTGNKIIPVIFICFSCIAFGCGIWTTVALAGATGWDDVSVSFQAATAWISSSMGTDLCIAAVMAYALRRKKTGFAHTDTVVDKIIRMTVQTGLITAVTNILDMLSFLFIKNSTFNFMWSNPLSKLYSNCMMSSLNARVMLKADLPTHVSGERSGQSGGSGGGISSTHKFVAARPFTLTKDSMGGSTFQNDELHDPEYGIQMNKVVERFE
ncbi:hypothetical protein C8R46DRAFT_1213456 [Mycena filopes]|nr:hypothetical protein C8R46DRAFT_1213456 [Mycena filopes]